MDPEREVQELRERVAQLESLVERLSADRPSAAVRRAEPASPGGLDRRRILRNGLGLSAAAVVSVGAADALGSTAAADTGSPVTVGQSVAPSQPSDPPTRLYNASPELLPRLLLLVDNTNDGFPQPPIPSDLTIALAGRTAGLNDPATTKVGVYGVAEFGVGVRGDCSNGVGVRGHTSGGGPGVKGTSDQDCGVWGESAHAGFPGVLGVHTDGQAVAGLSQTSTGVSGSSDSDIGVDGGSGSGIGVRGNSTSGAGISATSVSGAGVTSTSTNGPGVHASSGSGVGITATSAGSVGAQLRGGAAAVRLVPQTHTGHPTAGAHQRGELLVDAGGKPWLCTKGGSPGTWRQLAFV